MSETNIRLLANDLGLSISTVSKALKDSYEISAATKLRVHEAAKRLHYSPNPYASSLRRKKSNTIAVVIPDVADSFFSQALKGIEDVAQQKGYHVLVYLTYENAEKEAQILEECKNGRVDGVLLSVSSETCNFQHISSLSQNQIPLIYFDRASTAGETAKVVTDDFESGYSATKHLIEQGCRTIAFLSISNVLAINNNRLNGYRQALADHGILFDKKYHIQCSNNDADNYRLCRKMLTSTRRPDGILSSVEKLVTPIYSLCHELSIDIPRHLKVVSFSNSPVAHILHPSLTTITQPAFSMGNAAAVLLFKALKKPNSNWQKESIVVPSHLHVRDSTAVTTARRKSSAISNSK